MANKFYISDCHFPICEWNAYYRNSYHLFGHIHGRLGDNCLIMRSRRNAYNAAVDNIVNMCLIKMAQLNKRKSVLDTMRKRLPKAREEQRSYMSRNTVPEYRYINYDLELIKQEYEVVSKAIMEMQMALDRYNQTVQFEVNI